MIFEECEHLNTSEIIHILGFTTFESYVKPIKGD
jgi:hypothetical protein